MFQGTTEGSAYRAMARACKLAGVPHYHPHDLRHRRITIWHQSGVPARELAERAGHSRPSMSLDVYSHVMPPDEIASERFLSLLRTLPGKHSGQDECMERGYARVATLDEAWSRLPTRALEGRQPA